MTPKLLFFSGSIREGSFNKRLAHLAYSMALKQGVDATWLDLSDYPLPLYNGDLEAAEGMPVNAWKLKQMFAEHAGFFIACPEYNSSITPLLKNTLDWISRPSGHDPEPEPYKGKVAAISSASPGGLGGLRSLIVVRMMLGNIGVHMVPAQLAIPQANKAFQEDGTLVDAGKQASLEGVVQGLIDTAGALGRKV